MKVIFIILGITFNFVILTYLCIKIAENILNLITMNQKDTPKTMGIVFNKKSKKLKEDESIILPFN